MIMLDLTVPGSENNTHYEGKDAKSRAGRRKSKGNSWGYVIMACSLLFGATYFLSLMLWFKHIALKICGAYWWTWWVFTLPISLIVGFAVFFMAWIGWVMVKAKPKSVHQLVREVEAKASSQES